MQNLKDHFVSKHPKDPLPDGLEEGIRAAVAKKAANEKGKAAKAPPDGAGKKKKKKDDGGDLSLLMEGLGTGGKKKK